MLCKAGTTDLQRGPSWFSPQPFFGKDVAGWKPGETLVIDKTAFGYPLSLDRIAKGTWGVQAVMDVTAPNASSFTQAAGQPLHHPAESRSRSSSHTGPVELKLDRTFPSLSSRKPTASRSWRSKVDCSRRFTTAPQGLRAGVVLPASYAANPAKKYPIVYEIPGFGGTYRMAASALNRNATKLADVEVLHVILDPECHHGHHAFADSAYNGPCGQALIEELIPAIEKKFRAAGKPEGRAGDRPFVRRLVELVVAGHLPGLLRGCRSTAPDPVDFRDFQEDRCCTASAGENMSTGCDGKQRPIAAPGRQRCSCGTRASLSMEES